ncbi:MAG: NADAR family protein [Synergistaceae bacterium]|nr:NADAR family protein [Synergistaceae bacterium]MBQ3695014.1 NADAR family protein [Synergistaceae bacterium]MBQ6111410.1 NADAR family protein [Synergistaceae bacterium]MBQ9628838.1 NADAR family protein [Synergistaceae bacterium]MBR0069452.1 NADAR family protein [Synergistaceae bacterium]
MNSITEFENEYEFLSNFYEVSIEYDGLTYGSSEAAFQAQKCMTNEERLAFTKYNPDESKIAGKRVKLRSDWEDVKIRIMEEILRAKFTQHEDIAQKLINTGERILIEGNDLGDVFWGIDTATGEGENHLGKILMKIRGELAAMKAK